MALVLRVMVISVVLLLFSFAQFSEAYVRGRNGRPVGRIDCGRLCAVRCSAHSRPNVCTRACGTCCYRCKCVPPGTAGNRQMCGSCYANMTTHGGKLKCP